jgi:hypothetical protein
MWKKHENRDYVGCDLNSQIFVEEGSHELTDKMINGHSPSIILRNDIIDFEKTDEKDDPQTIAIYKLPKGTQVPEGFAIYLFEDGRNAFVPLRDSIAKRTFKCFHFERTIYLEESDFRNYEETILVFDKINKLPWVFKGHYKRRSSVKIPKKFKRNNQRVYKDPFGFRATLPVMLQEALNCEVCVNNYIDCVQLISNIDVLSYSEDTILLQIYYVLERFKRILFKIGTHHVFDDAGFSLMISDCRKKIYASRRLNHFIYRHEVEQEKRNEIHKSKIHFLGRNIEHKIVSFL